MYIPAKEKIVLFTTATVTCLGLPTLLISKPSTVFSACPLHTEEDWLDIKASGSCLSGDNSGVDYVHIFSSLDEEAFK